MSEMVHGTVGHLHKSDLGFNNGIAITNITKTGYNEYRDAISNVYLVLIHIHMFSSTFYS